MHCLPPAFVSVAHTTRPRLLSMHPGATPPDVFLTVHIFNLSWIWAVVQNARPHTLALTHSHSHAHTCLPTCLQIPPDALPWNSPDSKIKKVPLIPTSVQSAGSSIFFRFYFIQFSIPFAMVPFEKPLRITASDCFSHARHLYASEACGGASPNFQTTVYLFLSVKLFQLFNFIV